MAVALGLKRLVPASLRHSLSRRLLDLAALPKAFRARRAASASRGSIRVFYGHERLGTDRDLVHGGLVKFQRMQAVWPNTPLDFNVLYMVSSAMPAGAAWLADAARRGGAAIAWNQNGTSTPAWPGPGWRNDNAAMRPLLRRADHVFYQSAFCKEAADRFVGTPRGTWEVLHNAVDTETFTPAVGGRPPGEPVLLLGGNQDQRYRLETALGALASLARRGMAARLLVTGGMGWSDDGQRDATEMAHAAGVADRVSFLGRYSQRDAPALMRRADLLLHTKYNDPCPGLVVEALACGLPVVYSASGGVPELVGPEAGVGVPAEATFERIVPPDPEALADGVERVLAALPRYAEAARRRAVERLDLRPWLERHRIVFEELRG